MQHVMREILAANSEAKKARGKYNKKQFQIYLLLIVTDYPYSTLMPLNTEYTHLICDESKTWRKFSEATDGMHGNYVYEI